MTANQKNPPAYGKNSIPQSQKFLLEQSTCLIKTLPDEMDLEIDKLLKTLCRYLKLDHLYVYRLSEVKKRLTMVYASLTSKDRRPLPDTVSAVKLPWIMQEIRNGQSVLLKNLSEDLPQTAVTDGRLMEQIGLCSLFLFPILINNTLWGVLWASCLKQILSDQPTTEYLTAVQNIISAAIQRKEFFLDTNSLLQFDRLLSKISAKYINLAGQEIENAVQKDLEQLGRHMDADRCLLYLVDDDKKGYHTCPNKFFWYPPQEAKAVTQNEAFIATHPQFEAVYFSWAFDKWRHGESIMFTASEELPPQADMFKLASDNFGTKSHLSVPMVYEQEAVGALVILANRYHRTWRPDEVRRVRLYGEVLANALMRKQSEEKLRRAFMEIKTLKERIEADYIYLKDETEEEFTRAGIIGESTAIKNILVEIKKVAPTNTTVLLLGETGTGKGVIARAIHNTSRRKNRPLIQVNCAALSPSVIESELFGHEKGAYTGAVKRRSGRFEIADSTTLFLDEIGELPLDLQSKLLRVLESGEFERVGGSTTLKTDVRIIAATNRNLEQEAAAGTFRRDLWYRLSVFPIYLPPLRERPDDIALFIRWFIDKYGRRKGRRFEMISPKNLARLQSYNWPGNIRELENMVERAVIVSEGRNLAIMPPDRSADAPLVGSRRLVDFERNHILKVLQECRWKIQGPGGAAEELDMNAGTLRSRMKKLNIFRPSQTER